MPKTDNSTVRWRDIARAAFMLGLVSDFSKGEMFPPARQTYGV